MNSYSRDLRERVVKASQDRTGTQAEIGATFGISVSTLQDWLKRFEATGNVEPLPRGREQPLIKDEQASAVQAVVDRLPDATLAQYCEAWEQATGQRVSQPTMCRALQRFDRPRKKKTVAAAERDEIARQNWRKLAKTLPVERVTVFDESGTQLDMSSAYARAPRGERAYATERRNTGHNMTLLAGITLTGMTAPLVVEGSVTTAVMETYVQQVLLPTLRVGDIIILDNLSVHHTPVVTHLFTEHGCRVLFLPAYSPDFSPIENAFSKIKSVLRRLRAQTVDTLLDAIGQAIDTITPQNASSYFTHAGFLSLNALPAST
jgi:transposase